jgi:pilus assembly protein Flp/PilA
MLDKMLETFIALTVVGAKRDEKGATATEYGLLVGLIALIIVVGVGAFGNALNAFFNTLAGTVKGWN